MKSVFYRRMKFNHIFNLQRPTSALSMPPAQLSYRAMILRFPIRYSSSRTEFSRAAQRARAGLARCRPPAAARAARGRGSRAHWLSHSSLSDI